MVYWRHLADKVRGHEHSKSVGKHKNGYLPGRITLHLLLLTSLLLSIFREKGIFFSIYWDMTTKGECDPKSLYKIQSVRFILEGPPWTNSITKLWTFVLLYLHFVYHNHKRYMTKSCTLTTQVAYKEMDLHCTLPNIFSYWHSNGNHLGTRLVNAGLDLCN